MMKEQDLLARFIAYCRQKRLIKPGEKTLLAVSGGIDSVALCALFHAADFPFAIAHVNFQLRGTESDGDENFVRELGSRYGVTVHVTRFATKDYAAQKHYSIQLAARELRYTWFEQLRTENKYSTVATAHHLDDNIETILYNLVKGTGIRGLRGILPQHEKLIRPLLFASRREIVHFVQSRQLSFREDSSNREDKYTRNKIRHQVIPLLEEINPSLQATMRKSIDLFAELEELYQAQMRRLHRRLFLPRQGDIYIPILALKKTENAQSVLYEYLKDYGFTGQQVNDILGTIDKEAVGKQFFTSQARMLRDRRFFILTQLPDEERRFCVVQEKDTEVVVARHRLILAACPRLEGASVESSAANKEQVAADKLAFPLLLRQWRSGDYFYPLGMGMKKKKVKKFLTDLKVPLHEKEKVWVLESNRQIVWVVGYRIDERFKVSDTTKEVLRLKWQAVAP